MASGFDDFEQLARQYWNAWGETMRTATAPAQPAVPNWNDALGWWSQLAQGAAKSNPASGVDDAVNRFQSQAQQWFGQMQQLAAQFLLSMKDYPPSQTAGSFNLSKIEAQLRQPGGG